VSSIQKNEDYNIEITGYGFEGEGVGRIDGVPVFVQGSLPGEKVKVKIVKVAKSHAFGKLMDILTASEFRVKPICSVYKRCGGCQLQHLSYEEQLKFKHQRVKDCMERIGKLKDVVIHPTIGMKNPARYRNKVQLPVGLKGEELAVGFYALRSHDIIDMENCYIQDESADKAVSIIRQWMKKYKIQPYSENIEKIKGKEKIKTLGILRHIMVRKGFTSKEIMVVLVTCGKELPYKQELLQLIKENLDGIKSIIQNVNSKATNVILGKENILLWGADHITDYIGKFKFNISPLSFFQVNPIQTEVLYKKALEYANLSGKETVFDAYCGTGTISLFLSEKAKKVYGVEIVPEAIENAKANAEQNNITNVEFFVGEAETIIPELINKGIHAEVVVVDPPRKGCEKSLLEAIASMKPERIVYVSCDPSTLARDLNILEEMGYKTMEVQPVDMFPQTAHVETVVLMTNSGFKEK
jgi:23S rRNA (uracil1939-C5)-methyltransferase